MLVLLHFHDLGYSPVELAFLFLFYELFGVVTNLVGGFIAARMGLRVTLLSGLALQVAALGMLSMLAPRWSQAASVAYVMTAQALSGIAKDLTKMSSKSAIKVLVPEDASSALFKWVALLTGSKNALKGVGFFLGGFLLATLGFQRSLWAMAGVLLVVLVLAFLLAAVMALVSLGLLTGGSPAVVILGGLGAFGVVFAINSSVHSYLILAYSEGDKIATNVGFYYMANAGGRLVGTLLSGVMYQAAGLPGCLWTSVGFAAATGALSLLLPQREEALLLAEMKVDAGASDGWPHRMCAAMTSARRILARLK